MSGMPFVFDPAATVSSAWVVKATLLPAALIVDSRLGAFPDDVSAVVGAHQHGRRRRRRALADVDLLEGGRGPRDEGVVGRERRRPVVGDRRGEAGPRPLGGRGLGHAHPVERLRHRVVGEDVVGRVVVAVDQVRRQRVERHPLAVGADRRARRSRRWPPPLPGPMLIRTTESIAGGAPAAPGVRVVRKMSVLPLLSFGTRLLAAEAHTARILLLAVSTATTRLVHFPAFWALHCSELPVGSTFRSPPASGMLIRSRVPGRGRLGRQAVRSGDQRHCADQRHGGPGCLMVALTSPSLVNTTHKIGQNSHGVDRRACPRRRPRSRPARARAAPEGHAGDVETHLGEPHRRRLLRPASGWPAAAGAAASHP